MGIPKAIEMGNKEIGNQLQASGPIKSISIFLAFTFSIGFRCRRFESMGVLNACIGCVTLWPFPASGL